MLPTRRTAKLKRSSDRRKTGPFQKQRNILDFPAVIVKLSNAKFRLAAADIDAIMGIIIIIDDLRKKLLHDGPEPM